MTNEELIKENERLRRKLSPLEDPKFTAKLAVKLGPIDLSMNFQRTFRKKNHVVVTPSEVASMCDLSDDLHTLTNVGRSLQAMGWERSALHGTLVFVMELEEYKNGVQ